MSGRPTSVTLEQYRRVMEVREGWMRRGQEPVWNDTVTIRQIPEEVKP